MLGPQLVLTDTRAEQIVPLNKEDIIVPKAEEKLGVKDKVKAQLEAQLEVKPEKRVIPPKKSGEKPAKTVKKEEISPKVVVNKAVIEKQISGLAIAKKFAPADEVPKIEKQIKALEMALKFAA